MALAGAERIFELLNKNAYQVEFGTGGRNLSQLEMEKIKKLNLPGIDFIKSTKRYYPNGDFASYLLGYTKNQEDKDGNVIRAGAFNKGKVCETDQRVIHKKEMKFD